MGGFNHYYSMGKSESSTEESTGDSSEYESSEEFEPIDPEQLEEEGTWGLSDVLTAVGIDVGGKKQVLKDTEGNPIQPVYTEDGTYASPTLVDEQGNVIHEGTRGIGTAVATAVGVHYYRKKKKESSGKKGKGKKDKKKGKKGKKDKKKEKVNAHNKLFLETTVRSSIASIDSYLQIEK